MSEIRPVSNELNYGRFQMKTDNGSGKSLPQEEQVSKTVYLGDQKYLDKVRKGDLDIKNISFGSQTTAAIPSIDFNLSFGQVWNSGGLLLGLSALSIPQYDFRFLDLSSSFGRHPGLKKIILPNQLFKGAANFPFSLSFSQQLGNRFVFNINTGDYGTLDIKRPQNAIASSNFDLYLDDEKKHILSPFVQLNYEQSPRSSEVFVSPIKKSIPQNESLVSLSQTKKPHLFYLDDIQQIEEIKIKKDGQVVQIYNMLQGEENYELDLETGLVILKHNAHFDPSQNEIEIEYKDAFGNSQKWLSETGTEAYLPISLYLDPLHDPPSVWTKLPDSLVNESAIQNFQVENLNDGTVQNFLEYIENFINSYIPGYFGTDRNILNHIKVTKAVGCLTILVPQGFNTPQEIKDALTALQTDLQNYRLHLNQPVDYVNNTLRLLEDTLAKEMLSQVQLTNVEIEIEAEGYYRKFRSDNEEGKELFYTHDNEVVLRDKLLEELVSVKDPKIIVHYNYQKLAASGFEFAPLSLRGGLRYRGQFGLLNTLDSWAYVDYGLQSQNTSVHAGVDFEHRDQNYFVFTNLDKKSGVVLRSSPNQVKTQVAKYDLNPLYDFPDDLGIVQLEAENISIQILAREKSEDWYPRADIAYEFELKNNGEKEFNNYALLPWSKEFDQLLKELNATAGQENKFWYDFRNQNMVLKEPMTEQELIELADFFAGDQDSIEKIEELFKVSQYEAPLYFKISFFDDINLTPQEIPVFESLKNEASWQKFYLDANLISKELLPFIKSIELVSVSPNYTVLIRQNGDPFQVSSPEQKSVADYDDELAGLYQQVSAPDQKAVLLEQGSALEIPLSNKEVNNLIISKNLGVFIRPNPLDDFRPKLKLIIISTTGDVVATVPGIISSDFNSSSAWQFVEFHFGGEVIKKLEDLLDQGGKLLVAGPGFNYFSDEPLDELTGDIYVGPLVYELEQKGLGEGKTVDIEATADFYLTKSLNSSDRGFIDISSSWVDFNSGLVLNGFEDTYPGERYEDLQLISQSAEENNIELSQTEKDYLNIFGPEKSNTIRVDEGQEIYFEFDTEAKQQTKQKFLTSSKVSLFVKPELLASVDSESIQLVVRDTDGNLLTTIEGSTRPGQSLNDDGWVLVDFDLAEINNLTSLEKENIAGFGFIFVGDSYLVNRLLRSPLTEADQKMADLKMNFMLASNHLHNGFLGRGFNLLWLSQASYQGGGIKKGSNQYQLFNAQSELQFNFGTLDSRLANPNQLGIGANFSYRDFSGSSVRTGDIYTRGRLALGSLYNFWLVPNLSWQAFYNFNFDDQTDSYQARGKVSLPNIKTDNFYWLPEFRVNWFKYTSQQALDNRLDLTGSSKFNFSFGQHNLEISGQYHRAQEKTKEGSLYLLEGSSKYEAKWEYQKEEKKDKNISLEIEKAKNIYQKLNLGVTNERTDCANSIGAVINYIQNLPGEDKKVRVKNSQSEECINLENIQYSELEEIIKTLSKESNKLLVFTQKLFTKEPKINLTFTSVDVYQKWVEALSDLSSKVKAEIDEEKMSIKINFVDKLTDEEFSELIEEIGKKELTKNEVLDLAGVEFRKYFKEIKIGSGINYVLKENLDPEEIKNCDLPKLINYWADLKNKEELRLLFLWSKLYSSKLPEQLSPELYENYVNALEISYQQETGLINALRSIEKRNLDNQLELLNRYAEKIRVGNKWVTDYSDLELEVSDQDEIIEIIKVGEYLNPDYVLAKDQLVIGIENPRVFLNIDLKLNPKVQKAYIYSPNSKEPIELEQNPQTGEWELKGNYQLLLADQKKLFDGLVIEFPGQLVLEYPDQKIVQKLVMYWAKPGPKVGVHVSYDDNLMSRADDDYAQDTHFASYKNSLMSKIYFNNLGFLFNDISFIARASVLGTDATDVSEIERYPFSNRLFRYFAPIDLELPTGYTGLYRDYDLGLNFTTLDWGRSRKNWLEAVARFSPRDNLIETSSGGDLQKYQIQ